MNISAVMATISPILVYAVVSTLIITCLYRLMDVGRSFTALFKTVFIRVILSIIIILCFFYFFSKMFCWTAKLMDCIDCFCFPITFETLMRRTTVTSHILGAFVIVMQLVLLKIPKLMKPIHFVLILILSNIAAMLIKSAFVYWFRS